MPMWRNPMPWKKTPLTRRTSASSTQTDDMRPGSAGRAREPAGVRRARAACWSRVDEHRRVRGRRSASRTASARSRRAAADGRRQRRCARRSSTTRARSSTAYRDNSRSTATSGRVFSVTQHASAAAAAAGSAATTRERPTGRGTADDPDVVQGRPADSAHGAADEPHVEPWEAAPVTDEQLRNPLNIIPPGQRPRVVLRFADQRGAAGLGPARRRRRHRAARRRSSSRRSRRGTSCCSRTTRSIAARRSGSYFLVFNTILNFDQLNAGRKLDPEIGPRAGRRGRPGRAGRTGEGGMGRKTSGV